MSNSCAYVGKTYPCRCSKLISQNAHFILKLSCHVIVARNESLVDKIHYITVTSHFRTSALSVCDFWCVLKIYTVQTIQYKCKQVYTMNWVVFWYKYVCKSRILFTKWALFKNFQRKFSVHMLFWYPYNYIIQPIMVFEAAKPKIFTIVFSHFFLNLAK